LTATTKNYKLIFLAEISKEKKTALEKILKTKQKQTTATTKKIIITVKLEVVIVVIKCVKRIFQSLFTFNRLATCHIDDHLSFSAISWPTPIASVTCQTVCK